MENTNVATLSKKGIIGLLTENLTNCKDKSMKTRIEYTLKKCKENNAKDVAKEDLIELANEVLAQVEKPLPKENSLKVINKKATDKEVDSILDIIKEPATKSTAKVAPKQEAPKEKKAPVKVVQEATVTDASKYFPKSLVIEDRTFVKTFEPKNILDILKITDEGKDVIFASLWTKKMLREFDYDQRNVFGQKVKEFKDDLDLLQPVHISPEGRVIYAVSLYTEAASVFLNDHFDVDGELRYSENMEFNVYVSSDEIPQEEPTQEEPQEEQEEPQEPQEEPKKSIKKLVNTSKQEPQENKKLVSINKNKKPVENSVKKQPTKKGKK